MIFLRDYRIAYTTDTELIDDIQFPQQVHWFPETYDKVKTGLFYPPHRMAEKVLDSSLVKDIRENRVKKQAFILASGNANFAGVPTKHYDNRLDYEYKSLALSLTNVYAGRIAQAFGNIDHIMTDASACASSLKVMMDVQTLIEFYGFNRIIVLSVEDQINNAILQFFGETGASLTWKQEQDGLLPSAFDNVNGGFRLGQGAVLAVFEDEQTMLSRSASPKARLLGASSGSEPCTNAIGQREDGQGFANAIKGALHNAELDADDIAIIKTHGTGTRSNNCSEKSGIESVFKDFIATSYKPRIGHTMGASGLLETCLLIEDLNKGIVPKILNRSNVDDRYLSEDITNPGGKIMSLAAGMGNIYAAAVFDVECLR
jgi:3-oxoacyl-(acyl-carrier-protein) synthase